MKMYLYRLLMAGDILINTLGGGSYKSTISARVGYFANKTSKLSYFWQPLQTIIDVTFKPLDGPGHCLKAYEKDTEREHRHGNDYTRAILALATVLGCCIIAPITWAIHYTANKK